MEKPRTGDLPRQPRVRWLLFALVFPLALIPVEWLAARVKGSGPARHDTMASAYMPVRLEPNFSGEVGGLRFSTNRYGFRGSEDFPVAPAAGEKRVLALGDSVGFGWGIELQDHYTKVLEGELNLRRDHKEGVDSSWRVINAAGQGYSPSSYHAYLAREGLQFQPDLVLVQIELCNDVTDEALLSWQGRDASGGPDTVRGGRYAVAWDGNLLGTFALGYPTDRTYTYTLLLRRLLGIWWRWQPRGVFAASAPPPYFHLDFDRPLLTNSRVEAGWQRLFGALGATRRLLQERQIPLLLLIVPARYVFEAEGRPDTVEARRFLERAKKLSGDSDIAFVTAERELEEAGGARAYLDFAHPDAAGNRVIGQVLSQRLGSSYSAFQAMADK